MTAPERWWVMEEAALLAALREAANGANPDLVLMELTANSKTTEP